MRLPIACAALALLAGCQAPISSNLVQDVGTAVTTLPGTAGLRSGIATDIQDTQYNFNQAVQVGALSPNDPAPGCVNSIVALTGLGGVGPVTASFVPKVDGPASLASVAYIRLQQANGLGGNISAQIPVACLALIGKLNVDGLQQLNKAAISAIPIPGVSSVLHSLPVPLARPNAEGANPSLGGK